MIKEDELVKAGKITRTHGISGEVSLSLSNEQLDIDTTPYLVIDIESIYVPFFIESYRYKSANTVLVKFLDIEDDKQSDVVLNREVYFPKEYIVTDEDNYAPADYYKGYIVEVDGKGIGEIISVDDSTPNILFEVKCPNGEEILIPAADEFVEFIDDDKKIIAMNLPEGLLDLQ